MHNCSPAPSDTTDGYTTDDPNASAHDAYLPISPGSAASIMGQFQDLDETIRGVAYGLISTVHKRTIGYEVGKMEANARIKERDEEIAGVMAKFALLCCKDCVLPIGDYCCCCTRAQTLLTPCYCSHTSCHYCSDRYC
jgi:hypothetical protein